MTDTAVRAAIDLVRMRAAGVGKISIAIDTDAMTSTSPPRRVCALVALLVSGALGGCTGPGGSTTSTDGGFTRRVLVRGLANPWEITWGPDGYLWVTEKTTGRVDRVSPSDGTVQT